MSREPVTLSRHRRVTACLHFALTATLLVGLLVAATAISMGIANADDLRAIVRPDTGLMIGLMILAVGAMGALSAAAVHLSSRWRDR